MKQYEALGKRTPVQLAEWILHLQQGEEQPEDAVCRMEGVCRWADRIKGCQAFNEAGEFLGCAYSSLEKIRFWLESEVIE